MFRKSMKAKLQRIFDMPKVSFESPSEAKEQETIFVEIEKSKASVTNGRAIAKVTGKLAIFANSDKLPFGFINKRINSADNSDTAEFFFYNIDQNEKYYGNLVERQVSFVYFYNDQYDPDAGEIDSVNLQTTFQEGDDQ
jgi:hypothetical protein